RIVGATELDVGPSRKQHVAVKCPAVHPDSAHSGCVTGPLRMMVEPPSYVGDRISLRVAKSGNVVLKQDSVDAALEIDDTALSDSELDRFPHIGLERVDDIAAIHHHLAVDAVVIAAGGKKAARPVVPTSGSVGEPILGKDRVAAQLVSHISAGFV